jgi:tryptophan halogenase
LPGKAGLDSENSAGIAKRVETAVANIVIVGGGTAGWLAACMIAASAEPEAATPLRVTLIESPDIPTIGVGEGTWPTMRRTLERIGIDEAHFMLACDASFKQGTRFDGWRNGDAEDFYFHPFSPPIEAEPRDLVAGWRDFGAGRSFAETVSAQPRICLRDLAPRQRGMPDYAGALNYGYHLDAAKLAALLRRHGTERLGIRHLSDHVVGTDKSENGDISSVRTRASGAIEGDLFVDCTGDAALLIGKEYGVPFLDCGAILFNDRAIAVQVPVAEGSAIASQTRATAHPAGWIWDIGLPTRRGIGCVYSSRHSSDEEASAALETYIHGSVPGADPKLLPFRRLAFKSGHRERFWERNCLAIGLSAGFLEPLEASAIVLIELSINALLDNFPVSRPAMDLHASRFNALFRYRWARIIDFLKLHYVLSQRDEPYWQAHRDPASIPSGLSDLLEIWRDQPPSRSDFFAADELFPAASHQYILYGMGFPAPAAGVVRRAPSEGIARLLGQAEQRGRVLSSSLPGNRDYLDALRSQRGASLSMENAC